MPIDASVQGSPGWWLQRLAEKLYDRRYSPRWAGSTVEGGFYLPAVRPPLERLDMYRRNQPPPTKIAEKWGVTSKDFARLAETNWALLVTEGVRNRLVPNGWRTGADNNRDGDAEARRIADVNEFDIKFQDTAGDMLNLADGYMMVGGPRRNSDIPVITSEHPRSTITAEDPVTGEEMASLKILRDEWTGRDFVYLCIVGAPTVQYVAISDDKADFALWGGVWKFVPESWSWDESKGGVSGKPLPPAMNWRCPITRFPNSGGVGEYELHLQLLDRLNDGVFERIVIAKHQAFRQRALKGLPSEYPADHPKAGEEIVWDKNAFSADPGSLWDLPDGVDVWESQPIDLGPLRLANKDDAVMLAAVTSTPLYFITPDAASGSAEGATTQREAFIYRVEDRRRRTDSRQARVFSNCFSIMGDTKRAQVELIKTNWNPAERYSLLTKMQAAQLAKQAGLGQSAIYTDVMGYGPADVDRLEEDRAEGLLFEQQHGIDDTGAALPAPVAASTQPANALVATGGLGG